MFHGRSWVGERKYRGGGPTERHRYPGLFHRHIHLLVAVACMESCRSPCFSKSFQQLDGGGLERFNAIILRPSYPLLSFERLFPADHSGCNFLDGSSVRCNSLAIWPRVLVSGDVAEAGRSEKTFNAIAKLVDSSIIFSLRGWLDVALGHDQIGQFRDGIAENFNRNYRLVNSSRSTEVLNVPATLGGTAAQLFEIQILTDHGRGIKRSQPQRCKVSRGSQSEETPGRLPRKMG
jgi:hypothetical protein